MTDPENPVTLQKAVSVGKDPTTYAWLTYLWVFGLSSWGGFVSFMRKRRQGHARPFNVAEFVGEIATSAFAGVLTFYLAESAGAPQLLTAAMVAISGHMGCRAVFLIEKWMERKFPIVGEDAEK